MSTDRKAGSDGTKPEPPNDVRGNGLRRRSSAKAPSCEELKIVLSASMGHRAD